MLEFHPTANIFPLMEGGDYDALKADIAEHGQLEPIWLYEGKILDGRNRYRACVDLGLVPKTSEYTGNDPQSFVISLNLHRRHLTREQRDELIRHLRGNGYTLQRIADAVGVSYGTAHSAAAGIELINFDKLPGADGKYRPMQYAARAVEVAEDEPEEDEPDIYDLNIYCAGCIHCRTVDENLDFCKKYDKTIYPIGSMYGDLYGDSAQAATCEGYQNELETEPEPVPEPAKERANQAMGATVYSHNSLDYYTPRYVTDAAREVMGGIDLDPASCEMAQTWIGAERYYTITDDGLAQPWSGRVWLNPPYSYTDGRSNQDLWSDRLVTEYLQGQVTEGLLLVKAALGYKWFERLWDTWPVCFMRDRLSFVMPDGTDDGQSKQATAIFYIGGNVSKFVDVFRKFGRVILPEDQKYG